MIVFVFAISCLSLAFGVFLARHVIGHDSGTALALARPGLRSRANLLAREGSLYCSAFVQHCYASAGIELAPGIGAKNATPHDLAATRGPQL